MKIRLTKTDEPEVFEVEEIVQPTLGDRLTIRLNDLTAKIAELDAQLGLLRSSKNGDNAPGLDGQHVDGQCSKQEQTSSV